MGSGLAREGHEGFIKKLDKLVSSTRTQDRELAAIIKAEIDALYECKRNSKQHQGEDRLAGVLRDIGYIRRYKAVGGNKFSIRIYFTVHEGTLWLLDFIMKKRDGLEKGERKTLKRRLQEIKN